MAKPYTSMEAHLQESYCIFTKFAEIGGQQGSRRSYAREVSAPLAFVVPSPAGKGFDGHRAGVGRGTRLTVRPLDFGLWTLGLIREHLSTTIY